MKNDRKTWRAVCLDGFIVETKADNRQKASVNFSKDRKLLMHVRNFHPEFKTKTQAQKMSWFLSVTQLVYYP